MDLQPAQLRLARFYLARLRAAETEYRRGSGAVDALGQDWAQIAHWQAWAAQHSQHNPDAARLCAAFPQLGAEVLVTRQTPAERIAWFEAGVAAAQSSGDPHGAAACAVRLAWAVHKQATLDDAERAAQRALARTEALRDEHLLGQNLHLLGEIAVRRGQITAALPLLERSRALLSAADAQAALADVLFSLAEIAYLRGEFARARDASLACYQIHQQLGFNPAATNNLTCLGMFTAEAGAFAAGEAYVRESINLARASGAQGTLAHALKTLAGFQIMEQEWAAASAVLTESLTIAQAAGEAWLIPDILIFRARIAARTGQHAAAARDAEEATAISRGTGYVLTLLEALLNVAEVQVAAGRLDAARTALVEGLRLAQSCGTHVHSCFGLFIAAQRWLAVGAYERAAEIVGLLEATPATEIAVRRALPELLEALSERLDPAALAAARARGRTIPLDAAVSAVA